MIFDGDDYCIRDINNENIIRHWFDSCIINDFIIDSVVIDARDDTGVSDDGTIIITTNCDYTTDVSTVRDIVTGFDFADFFIFGCGTADGIVVGNCDFIDSNGVSKYSY